MIPIKKSHLFLFNHHRRVIIKYKYMGNTICMAYNTFGPALVYDFDVGLLFVCDFFFILQESGQSMYREKALDCFQEENCFGRTVTGI